MHNNCINSMWYFPLVFIGLMLRWLATPNNKNVSTTHFKCKSEGTRKVIHSKGEWFSEKNRLFWTQFNIKWVRLSPEVYWTILAYDLSTMKQHRTEKMVHISFDHFAASFKIVYRIISYRIVSLTLLYESSFKE